MASKGGEGRVSRFSVIYPGRDPIISTFGVLQQDNWNDYSFQTQYHLYVKTEAFTGLVGTVKILRRGQTEADGLQLSVGPLDPLGEDFCSLGQTLDYYERLASLPEESRSEIMAFLQDALAFPDHAESFFGEEGWRVSVLRDINWETFRRDASVLLDRDYDKVARLGLDLSFQVTGWNAKLDLQFAAPTDWHFGPFGTANALPARIAVLTGRNGSGKSTLLARLARVLHASQRDRARDELRRLGTIDPPGIGFTRVLNLAYSAFDAFQIPGIDERERRQITEDLKQGTGRYHFCGLRDIAREFDEGLHTFDAADEYGTAFGPSDRQHRTLLKSADQLADEFARIVGVIIETERQDLFGEVVSILTSDPSFEYLGITPAEAIQLSPAAMFGEWSTGHKIVMHAACSLVAYTQAKSIILIDEPESHLHPPLLASFMHAVRHVLEKNDAFAVVATHSPVVAQETLGQHVSVVRRSGDNITITPPRIETYGESIGEISDEVFGLNSDATDFHKALRSLVQANMSLEEIEALFQRGLSLQARAYVMTELARKPS
jgi:energy-coupling factor transporter ATP-binding protein EcfA2